METNFYNLKGIKKFYFGTLKDFGMLTMFIQYEIFKRLWLTNNSWLFATGN